MIDEELLNKFDRIQDLPVSEEMLGAYMEGSLHGTDLDEVRNQLSSNDGLVELINDITESSVDVFADTNNLNHDFEFSKLELPSMTNEDICSENIIVTNKAFAIYGEDGLNQISDFVQQLYPDTCAIKAQQLVLERFGISISEEELRSEAIVHGWYSPGKGTPMEDIGNLLKLHGIDIHQYVNGNICNVINELAQGHQVIMGVDSGELWDYGLKEKIEDLVPGIGGPDHALIVSGINTDNPHNVKVIITDPGTGDLCKEYSLSQFVDAANDSHFYMVTTDSAVPNIFDSFGEGIEHLPIIGNMTYDYFVDNYAYLHDVYNRPVFEEFISQMHNSSTVSSFLLNNSEVALIDQQNSEIDNDYDGDDALIDDLDIDF